MRMIGILSAVMSEISFVLVFYMLQKNRYVLLRE